ncbi:MAG: rRNA maturation RNase YbeY [Candidatus Paceibacterota bacterium]
MDVSDNLTISQKNLTRRPLPQIPFLHIKNKILGSKYNLSLVFMADTKARSLNKIMRHKNTAANVLSFPLTKTEGEIFINLARSERDHKKYDMTYLSFVAYLFIHGLLHLKGYSHGSTMERIERQTLASLNLHDQKYRHRA